MNLFVADNAIVNFDRVIKVSRVIKKLEIVFYLEDEFVETLTFSSREDMDKTFESIISQLENYSSNNVFYGS